MDLSWNVEFAGLLQMLLHCVIGLKEKIMNLVVRKLFPNGWRGILMKEMKLVCMANNMIFGPV